MLGDLVNGRITGRVMGLHRDISWTSEHPSATAVQWVWVFM